MMPPRWRLLARAFTGHHGEDGGRPIETSTRRGIHGEVAIIGAHGLDGSAMRSCPSTKDEADVAATEAKPRSA